MRSSIVSKTIVVLPFIFFLAEANAGDLVGAARDSMGVASPSSQVSAPASAASVPVSVDPAVSAFDSLKCLKLGEPSKGNIAQFQDAANQLTPVLQTCSPDKAPAIQSAINTYLKNQPLCMQRNQTAGRNCLEQCSTNIKGMVSAAQILMAGMNSLSITDSCSKMGDLMNLAQGGMTAFSVACGAEKLLCDTSCGAAAAALKTLIKSLPAVVPPPGAPFECASQLATSKEPLVKVVSLELTPEPTSVAGKQAECSEYVVTLGAAAAGIVSMVQKAKQANACEKATNGTQASLTGAADSCSTPAGKDTPQCICKANPRSPGCELSTNLSGDGSSGFGHTGDGKTPAGLSSGSGLGADSGLSNSGSIGGGGPSGAAPPVGGGGGSAGLGSGNSGSNDGRGANDTITKTNTSIYGGEGGGGGGGAFGSRGGGGAQKTAAYNPAFAQKISADREIASLRNQVSSQGGKSNWEKVKDRYTQEKTNLLGR